MGSDAPPPRGLQNNVRLVLRLAIVASVLLALIVVEFTSRSGVAWRLITFTYQANILAAAYYAWTLVSPKADGRTGLRGAVVLYLLVAGLVWNLFLTERSMGYTPANLILHAVVPVLALVDWVLVGRGTPPARWWQPFAWLSYPAAYGAVAVLVLNRAGRRAPYFFLDPSSVGIATVAMNIGLMAAGMLGLGFVLLALTRTPAANVS